jgi:phytoene dehydrogenase-like protein
MLRSSYDVVIVGMDLPALVFGALAAKKGYRVLVLGHGAKDNVYELDGFRFVRRPSLFVDFQESNPIREVFRELALAPEMRNLPRPMSPTCSVVMPGARIEVSRMKGVLEEEIAREFPGQIETFRDFSRRVGEVEKSLEPFLREYPVLPPGTIREYLDFRRYRKGVAPLVSSGDADGLAPLGDDPRLRAFFAAPMAALSGVSEPWRRPLPFVRLASHLLRGFYHVEWGLDALKTLFLDRVRNNSGDVRPSDHVDMMLVNRGGIQEVEIRARDEAIGVGMLVVGTDLSSVLELVPEKSSKKRFKARVDRIQPTHRMVTLNVGAHRDLIPEGMAQTAFVVRDPAAPLQGSNLLVVQTDPAMEPPDVLDPRRATISVSGLLPADRFDGKPACIEAFSAELVGGLRELMPFLDRHQVTLSSAAVGTHAKTGQPVVDPAGLVPIYGQFAPRGLDLVSWPVRTAYKNVLYLGEGASGPLGFEGAFVSAFMAFQILRKKIQLKSVM